MSARAGLFRELAEELAFAPAAATYLADLVYPRWTATGTEYDLESYYVVRVTADEIASMRLGEGEAMLLMSLAELRSHPRVVPPHLCAILYHATGILSEPPYLDA